MDGYTLFDMASVTKIIVTTTLTLMAADEGKLGFRDKVSRYFRVPQHYSGLEICHLLTHTMGLGHKDLTKSHFTYETIAEKILSLPPEGDVGREVRYSCPAFLILGKLLEKIYDESLDVLFRDKIAIPLKMKSSEFRPDTSRYHIINSNLKDCNLGIVNDYNCRYLGGVGGNAGLFSDIEDVTRYVQMILHDGGELLSNDVLNSALKNYTPGMSESRGLEFLYVDDNYTQTNGFFPVGSFGHCGHTGTSVFFNRENGLYVIILTDATISTVKKIRQRRLYQSDCYEK